MTVKWDYLTVNGEIAYQPLTRHDSDTATWTPGLPACKFGKRLAAQALVAAEIKALPHDAADLTKLWQDGKTSQDDLGQGTAVAKELLGSTLFKNEDRAIQRYAATRSITVNLRWM